MRSSFNRWFDLGIVCLVAGMIGAIPASSAGAQEMSWEDVYNPLQMLQLNLELNKDDWAAIVADDTYEVDYLPTLFWADGEDPILVGVKRKSATPIGTFPDWKVSLKVDINEFVKDQTWHDLKKFRLENGDDQNVVYEALAWYIHGLASMGSGPSEVSPTTAFSYESGFAAWINLTVYLTDYVYDEGGNHVLDENYDPVTVIVEKRNEGVYVHNEEHDKQFLKNRGLWLEDETWLYKHDERGTLELKAGDGDSPAYLNLDYSPFRFEDGAKAKGKNNSDVPPPPGDEDLYADLNYWIDMNSMLSLAAANTFASNPDGLFNHDQNAYFTDFQDGRRTYHAHDLDSAITSPEANIYAKEMKKGRKTEYEQAAYQEVILNHPDFRAQYNGILESLLDAGDDGGAVGPLYPGYPGGLLDFLDAAEPLLADALVADPNSKFGSHAEVADQFNGLRNWVVARWTSVLRQLEANGPPAPRE